MDTGNVVKFELLLMYSKRLSVKVSMCQEIFMAKILVQASSICFVDGN
jgi:hypothetical protein